MKPIAIGALLLLLAGCASGPTVREVLTSPAGQSDPLKALAQSGYSEGSEPYLATKIVLGQGISAKDPRFATDVYNEIVTMDLGKATNTIQN